MAKLTGKVTRLVPADEARGIGAKVFFLPDDRAACRWIDGRHQAASGELHVFGDVAAYKVGDDCAVEYDPDDSSKAPKLVPVAVNPPAPPATDPVVG